MRLQLQNHVGLDLLTPQRGHHMCCRQCLLAGKPRQASLPASASAAPWGHLSAPSPRYPTGHLLSAALASDKIARRAGEASHPGRPAAGFAQQTADGLAPPPYRGASLLLVALFVVDLLIARLIFHVCFDCKVIIAGFWAALPSWALSTLAPNGRWRIPWLPALLLSTVSCTLHCLLWYFSMPAECSEHT